MDLAPAPNGLWNRWNLGLPWGNCSGPECRVRDNLLKCGACRAISYCSVAHQVADRPRHKSSCKILKNAREELAKEEAALRAAPGDMWMPANPFETVRGHFWGISETRPYMRARHGVTDGLLNIRTGEAAEECLDHHLEMLQLCRGDNMGVRSRVPGLYLRLGRDQEAYDFVKWWATIGSSSDYDWGDMDNPFLNLHDEDVFETVEPFVKRLSDVSMLACLTNLKIRLLLDLQMLEQTSKQRGNENASYDTKMEWVREHAICDVLYKRRDIVERSGWSDIIGDLDDQVGKLIECVKERNKHYWSTLRTPERWATPMTTFYSPESPQEAHLAFGHTWYAWAECPAALETIKIRARV
ncbi:hypothetical protein GGS26DRAFT_135428 [Hypomontagnella submonticulosa]|nr:hypothetical protein GGS26DRAFT_135428 [Hypomontagnella submonticulosa]